MCVQLEVCGKDAEQFLESILVADLQALPINSGNSHDVHIIYCVAFKLYIHVHVQSYVSYVPCNQALYRC